MKIKYITCNVISLAAIVLLSGCGDPQKDFDEGKMALKGLNITQAYQKFRSAADGGHPEAQFIVAQAYEDPTLLGPNKEESLKWYKKSAKNKYPQAMLKLADMHLKGNGVKKDEKVALDYIKEAADLDCEEAKTLVRGLLSEFPSEEEKEAVDLLKWAISKSKNTDYYDKSIRSVARKNIVLALDWCANKGEANDIQIVGNAYEYGRGYKQNLSKAFDCYKKLVDLNDERGETLIYSLANKYYEPAIDWVLQKSKDTNQVLDIAKLYLEGNGVKKNEKKAFELIKKISEANSEAMYTLAGLYEKGIGCSADLKLYVETLKKSAEKANGSAAYDLGNLYKNGKYVEKNESEAKKYFDAALKSSLNRDLKSKAAFYVGEILMKSDSPTTMPNFDLASQYFSASSQLKENVDARINLCVAKYFLGERVSFSNFAKSEDAMALYRYGCELYYGENTKKDSVQYFSKAAEKGSVMARYYLAKMYKTGDAVEKNETKADELFKAAQKDKDLWQQKWANEYHLFLADSYENALGCKEDKAKAYEEYLHLAKKGLVFAQFKVAEFLRDGIGVKKNSQEALNWFYTIYKKNYSGRAAYEIGKLCISGELGGIDSKQALDYFSHVSRGDEYFERAKFEKGKIYFYGIGVKPDYMTAYMDFKDISQIPEAELLTKVARENGSDGMSYINSVRKEAFPVYEKYAQQFPMAKFRLARAYRYGYGTSRNLKKAAELFAELPNDTDATYELAMMYFDGLGVEQNDAKAYELFNKAKEGSLRAQYRAAVCLMQGIGCEKDEKKAAEAFNTLLPKLKTNAGFTTDYQKVPYPEALYMISQLYRNGWGVSKNPSVVEECADKGRGKYNWFRYDEGIDWEAKGKYDVAKLAYEDAAENGVPMAFVRLAAYVGNNANLRNTLLDKAIELGCREAYLIKAGKVRLTPFGRVSSSASSNSEQGESSLKKVNNALQNISTGLRQFNELFK